MNGIFKLTFSADINIFKTQLVNISTDIPDGYISIFEKSQSEVGFSIWAYVPELSDQKLVLFEKADLTVTFNRTNTDVFDEMKSTYNYSEWYNYGIPVIQHDDNLPNPVTYHIETAAGTYTKIFRTKKLPSGQVTTFRDSVFCLPNTTNGITINY